MAINLLTLGPSIILMVDKVYDVMIHLSVQSTKFYALEARVTSSVSRREIYDTVSFT